MNTKDRKMEADDHFKYGPHSSANSGLKLSSGDSPYTNGSSTSLPQQGKSMNGELNVNGITTVVGSSVSGSQPPTAPYPQMSNHHQSNRGFDYLWGGHSQYGPPMGSLHGHGIHQKQSSPGLGQPQSQHHYQGRGQYQLNGSIEGSRQSPVVGPSNMALSGGQYWTNNPQQINYSSHNIYGTYHSQAHPGITPSQHHQQQSLQPPRHQGSSQQLLHPHRHPPHQHQQQQHYGLMPNGMPYYQQQQPQQSQPPNQAQIIPSGAQSYTSPCGSPQRHSIGKGGSSSPLPVGMSSASMRSPLSTQDSLSPQRHNRERSPQSSNAGTSVIQAHIDVDKTYNDKERESQKHPKDDQPKKAALYMELKKDYRPHSENSATHCPKMPSPVKEPAANVPPQTSSPQLCASVSPTILSTSLPKGSTPLQSFRVSSKSFLQSSAESTSKDPTSPQMSTPLSAPSPADPLRCSSPPFRSVPLGRTETTIDSSTNLSPDSSTHSVTGSSPARPFFSSVHQTKAASGLSLFTSACSTPLSTLPKMVQSSKVPQMTACFPDSADSVYEKSVVPSLTSANSSVSVIARAEGASVLVPAKSTSIHNEVATPSQHQKTCSVTRVSPMSPTALAVSVEAHGSSSAANESCTGRPLPTLPRLTTQASRTAPVSVPADALSVPPAKGTLSGVVQSYNFEQHPPNTTRVQKQLSPKPDHYGHSEDSKDLANTVVMHKEKVPNFDSGTQRTPRVIKAAEKPDLPVKHMQTIVAPLNRPSDKQTENYHMQSAVSSERLVAVQAQQHESFDRTSYLEDSNTSLLKGDASEGISTAYNTTRESSFSAQDSRDNTSASSNAWETSQESFQVGEESALESSLNNTSQMEETSIKSCDVSMSHSFVSSQPSHQGREDQWVLEGHDTPDSAGLTYGIMTPKSFRMRDEFVAFSTPAENSAVQSMHQVIDQVVLNTEGQMKSPGKLRKPRTPKGRWSQNSDSQTPEQTQRKPRGRTPKIKTNEENKGDIAKEKGATRKRKKCLKEEAVDGLGMPGSVIDELDPIAATIEAVLANASALGTCVEAPKKIKRVKKQDQDGCADASTAAEDGEDHKDDSSTTGESNKRRVATEEQVQFPLLHGWKREIRVRKIENRMRGETWYYSPCGRRMKQFPEIIKYLKKHQDSVVSREHFSFSPRMPVGDFFEERETPEGLKWVLLANEEVPSMIMAITGRRGRPPNPDKEKPRRARGLNDGPRRPGRPPKPKMMDFLSKVDAKLLKRLEAKETLTEEDKEKIGKIKKKIKRKARLKRKQDAKIKKMKEEKKKAKLEQEASGFEGKMESTQPTALTDSAEPKKPGRRRSVKTESPPVVPQTDEERIAQGKRVLGARSKAKALAKAQAEAEAAAQAALAAKRAAERRAQAQRRLEERKRQQIIAEELKKPTEDMCLTDHKPLPELSRIPGVVLSGTSFAHCLAVVEFLYGYGKLLGLNIPKDIPSLATLQEGLLGLGDSPREVQDLLIKLLEAALQDPGLPSYYQSVKILGDKLADLELNHNTVSEVLRIFLESHGYETEVCNTLRTKPFHALPPDTKASILGFLVEELNGSNIITSDIDNTLENMTTYRKNKWIIEGKLRKLKAVLARRTGRSEEELCFEERRRRSARVAEEENSLEESGLVLESRHRRGRKEEPKLSDSESPTNASIPELERQIDKLSKRQAFFRKKLLQSSHSTRAILLGQDRYRRRYMALPHLGVVLVEGPEEILTSGEVLIAEVPVAFLKKEPKKEFKKEETPVPTIPPSTLPSSPSLATPGQAFSPDEDSLPGTASLMSRPRGRGRPRKIKPEVELHLRTAKIRRRRRSSARSCVEEGPGSPQSDLTQAALQSWLSQSQEALTNGTCVASVDSLEGNCPEESVKQMAEKQGQWFNLLPKQPCDDKSISEPQAPVSPHSPPRLAPQISSDLPALATPLAQPTAQPDLQTDSQSGLLPDLASTEPKTPALPQEPSPVITPVINPITAPVSAVPEDAPQQPAVSFTARAPARAPARALHTPSRPGRRRRRGSRGSSPARRGPRGAAAKRRGRPPCSVFQELEQQYFTQMVAKPIPASMVRGWWWIQTPEELYYTLQSLHPRGIRERVLHKHLAKHMENLAEMCTKPIDDPLFEMKVEQKDVLFEALQQPWQVQEKAMETDISALKWVEDLEQRVFAADLHLRAPPQNALNDVDSGADTALPEFQSYTVPDPDSTRGDLQYYEHDTDPRDDWIIRTKKEWSGLPRIPTHPLDLAVLRLANLERNIERKYLKEPLWNPAEVMRLAPLTPTPGEEQPMDVISLENEITSRLRTWRQALDRCRSAPQLCLCLLQLEKAIAWERSVTKVTCQVCRKGDNDECLLLCDGCDRGCHMYCLRPKITQVPEGDWFCPTCVAKNGESESNSRSSKKRTRVKKRRYEDDSSDDETSSRRSGGMTTRHKEMAATQSSSRSSGESGAAKRRRMMTRNQPDLTFCEIILMEMEGHADAWPFLEPVNPRLVPGYRRIVKNPMDLLTMRERLLQGGYCSCEEFAADAQLVFNNCELFNEDTSEVGMAGHSMRQFFESRWAEFYSDKDK